MNESPVFAVSAHTFAIKLGGRLFEPDPDRVDVILRQEGRVSGFTIFGMDRTVAEAEYSIGSQFRLTRVETAP